MPNIFLHGGPGLSRFAEHGHYGSALSIDAAAFDEIDDEDVMRFDHAGQSYAIYRVDGEIYASDGLCTHEHVHLCDGLVMGHTIGYPTHKGRFDLRDGRALCAPVCEKLRTYPARAEAGRIFIEI